LDQIDQHPVCGAKRSRDRQYWDAKCQKEKIKLNKFPKMRLQYKDKEFYTPLRHRLRDSLSRRETLVLYIFR
jgi:hypothetical protein